MKIIAKVIESILTNDATQQWTGQTSAWGWNPIADETSTIL